MKYTNYPTLEAAVLLAVLIGSCPDTRGQCEHTKLVASDGTTADRFGTGVALSRDGRIALIGAYTDDANGFQAGSAYVLILKRNSWIEVQKLEPIDPSRNQQFGRSVALTADGSVAVIGAWKDDDGGSSAGAAYVFVNEGSLWKQQSKLVASDSSNGDNFGISVGISAEGETIIVGSYLVSEPFFMIGAAYVYQFDDSRTRWIEQAKLMASDGGPSDQFGVSVAVSANGDTALIGAHKAAGLGNDTGAAYVFVRTVGELWLEQTKLFESGVGVGHAVALSADAQTALIGAPHGGSGIAHVFANDGANWEHQTALLPIYGDSNDLFGISLALSLDGHTAVVGDSGDTHGGVHAGSAFFFSIETDTKHWVQQRKFLSSDIAPGDSLGRFTAIAGSTILVSAMKDTNEGGSEAGAAYIFDLTDQFTDCNGNTINDDCEILSGVDHDCNSNGYPDDCDIDDDDTGVPDDCEAIGDLNGDGSVGVSDFLILLANWGPCADCAVCPADLNGDCAVGVADLLILLGNWG